MLLNLAVALPYKKKLDFFHILDILVTLFSKFLGVIRMLGIFIKFIVHCWEFKRATKLIVASFV